MRWLALSCLLMSGLAACMTAPDAPATGAPPAVTEVAPAESLPTRQAAPVHANTPLGIALRQTLLEGAFFQSAAASNALQAATIAEARAAWRPSLSAGIDAGISTASDPDLVPTLRLSQRLYDGGVSANRLAAAEIRNLKTRAETRTQMGERALTAIRAWEELYLARALLTIAQATDARLAAVKAQTEMRLEAGVGRNADALRVTSRRAEAASLRASAEGRVRAARAQVAELFAAAVVSGQIPAAPSAIGDIDTNPVILALRAEERAARRDQAAVAAGRLPTVFLDVSAQAPPQSDPSVGAGLRLGYEFGTNGRQTAALASAAASIAQAVATRELAESDLRRALANARDRQGILAAELTAARTAARTAQAALDDAEAQFSAGRADILDLLELGRDVDRTAARAVELASDARVAGFVVLYLTGELLDVFGICPEGCPA